MKTTRAPRTSTRFVSILLVLFLLLSASPIMTFALETQSSNKDRIVLNGSFEGTFELTAEQKKLFHLQNIGPGDTWSDQIFIKNKAPGEMSVSLLTIHSNLEDMVLFNALTLDLAVNGEPVYYGSYNTGLDPITKTYVLAKGETLTFDITVALPVSVGNEVINKEMDSTWTFEAFYTNPADKPQTGNNLIAGNTISLTILFVAIFALSTAVLVYFKIRQNHRTQNRKRKEENNA